MPHMPHKNHIYKFGSFQWRKEKWMPKMNYKDQCTSYSTALTWINKCDKSGRT